MLSLYQRLWLLSFVQTCFSWTHSTTVDLAWPPIYNQGYVTINSTIIGNLNTDFFPCSREPVNESIPRIIFPTTDGRLQFNLSNTTDLITYKYIGDIYLGQFSGDTTPDHNATAGIVTYVWKNFKSGPDCGEPMNVTRLVNKAFNRDDISERDIIGMNATFGVKIVLFSTDPYYDYPRDIYNVEEMYQVGHLFIFQLN
jgi:hypothetical protein